MKKDHPAQTVPPFAWILVCALLALAASFTACGAEGPLLSQTPPPAGQAAVAGFGQTLPSLTPQDVELFLAGRDDFLEVEDAPDGLGPIFNALSCAQCHAVPNLGGSGSVMEMRAGTLDGIGNFTDPPGGSLINLFSLPPHTAQEVIPANANVTAFRRPIPLFGAGLVEAIPDSAILALANQAGKPPGVAGRAHLVTDPGTGTARVGRFGWKANFSTLRGFAAGAYRDEMGITNELFPLENAPNGDASLLPLVDISPDPEDFPDPVTGRSGVDNFTNFMRFLAPPPRGAVTATAQQGEAVFQVIGCASCHTPVLTTAANAHPAFDRKPVPLFSDLLLHDIGTGDGIKQDDARPNEIRTPALWGLRVRAPFLHDGRAATVEQAILLHAAEAAAVRLNFLGLAAAEKQALLDFLSSL
ncbi:MAG TPA: di-heme oxidoredictase family protein [Candidatus Acidoferrales bacterium]